MTARRPSTTPAAQMRRRRIIGATRELLREREAAKVIVLDISVRADVAPATVYNLVGTRDQVIRAVLDDAISQVEGRVEPVDPTLPIGSIISLITAAGDVLLEDALAYRRAIGAMGDADDGGWLETTMDELLHSRLRSADAAFDGSIPLPHLAEAINVAFRGVLISWSYGHIADDDLNASAVGLALHVLGTTARPDIAFDIKRQLIALAKGAP